MKPTVGISISDLDACAQVFHIVRDELGMRALVFDSGHMERWQLLIDGVGRDAIVCVVDDNPETVMAATALGIHAMVFRPPPTFPWHLVMSDTGPDAKAALAYRLKEWNDKHGGVAK